MKVLPLYHDDPLLMGAFMSCAVATCQQPGAVESFMEETGIALDFLTKPRSAVEAMIDESCGRDGQAMAAWCDWVAMNVWGVDGDEGTDEAELNRPSEP